VGRGFAMNHFCFQEPFKIFKDSQFQNIFLLGTGQEAHPWKENEKIFMD
jgi:hypothetical protein